MKMLATSGPHSNALIYVGLGETNEAIRQLQLAYEDRSGGVLGLKVDPCWVGLREDSRFAELIRKIGLEQLAKTNETRAKSTEE